MACGILSVGETNFEAFCETNPIWVDTPVREEPTMWTRLDLEIRQQQMRARNCSGKIDRELVITLAAQMVSDKEIAEVLGISVRTLRECCTDELERGRARISGQMKKVIYCLAMAGDVHAMIFLLDLLDPPEDMQQKDQARKDRKSKPVNAATKCFRFLRRYRLRRRGYFPVGSGCLSLKTGGKMGSRQRTRLLDLSALSGFSCNLPAKRIES
jgi:hypothetical protein